MYDNYINLENLQINLENYNNLERFVFKAWQKYWHN